MKALSIPAACLLLPILLLTAACSKPELPTLAPQPSPSQLQNDGSSLSVTAVDVSSACRKLAKKVAYPHEAVGDNVFALRQAYRRQIDLANKRIGATDDCLARLAADYAQGLPPLGDKP